MSKEISKLVVPKMLERKILRSIALKRELVENEAEIKSQLQDVMEEYGVYSIKSENYSVTLASRTSYKAKNLKKVNAEYIKPALDTTKVAGYEKLYDKLPAQIEKSITKYITWKERNGAKD